jgi:hypothetical protein
MAQSSRSRQVILFLAANVRGTSRLALDEECAAIERELRMTTGRDGFEVRSKWAVNVDEMMRHLNEEEPTIVHFSGHGGRDGGRDIQDSHRRRPRARRDVVAHADAVIQLQGERGEPQLVTGRALTRMIQSAAASARLIVLNACFGSDLASELLHVVDCVVGMRGTIVDDAARSFAVGFYRALGNGKSIGNAVEQARATLAAKQPPYEELPVCRTRDGVVADQLFL